MVPPEGDTYKGKFIPPGTFIGLNAWGLQLNPVFGDDPQVFRPERWLIDDADRLKEMERVHELIFGYGTTRCLGIPIAMMNLNKIFVEVSKLAAYCSPFPFLFFFSLTALICLEYGAGPNFKMLTRPVTRQKAFETV